MRKNTIIAGMTLSFTLALFSLGFCEESMTITTYYPSPYGSYNDLYVANSLGIGTTGSASLLHVYGTVNGSHSIVIDAQGVGSGQQATLNLVTLGDGSKSLGNSATKGWHFSARGNAFTGEQNNLGLWYWDGTVWNTRMYWQNGGNVGIGTASPQAKLEVLGTDGNQIIAGRTDDTTRAELWAGTDGAVFEATNVSPGAGLHFYIAGSEKMRITNVGNVGIGTASPTYRLQLSTDSAGKPNGGSWSNSSDMRVKKNIKDIENPLELMLKLHGREFEWINPEEHGNLKNPRFGFIAQETENILPDWFSEVEPQGKDREVVKEGNIKSINVFGFEALTVEAIRQLKAENDSLKARIKAMEEKLGIQQ